MAQQIFKDCGSFDLFEISACFAKLKTAKEVRDKIRVCCRNANAGKEVVNKDGSLYKVPSTNERAACALLDVLLKKDTWKGVVKDHVLEMRRKMRG